MLRNTVGQRWSNYRNLAANFIDFVLATGENHIVRYCLDARHCRSEDLNFRLGAQPFGEHCASRADPTQACSDHSSMRPRASAMAPEDGSRSLLLRLMFPRAGSRFQRSLFRHRAHGKQWSMCGEDRIRDADHTQVRANPPSRNCFARSSATRVS